MLSENITRAVVGEEIKGGRWGEREGEGEGGVVERVDIAINSHSASKLWNSLPDSFTITNLPDFTHEIRDYDLF